jgi:integrase
MDTPLTDERSALAKAAMTGKQRKLPVKRDDWPRIRDTKATKGKRYVVDLRPVKYGPGSRLYFATLDDAKLKAKQLAVEHTNKGTESIQFPSDLRIEAADCAKRLLPYGKRLQDAVDHYVKFLETERARIESLRVADCIDKYLAARELELQRGDLSEISMREVRGRMKQFKAAWGDLPIMAITRHTITDYLNSIPHTARTRVNVRARMSKLFSYCVQKEWIDVNPVTAVEVKAKTSEVRILTVKQAADLMAAAKASSRPEIFVPYFAIALFAGMRPGEVEQLDWSRIDFSTNTIEVLAHTSKVRESRFVHMEPNLLQWLTPHKKSAGSITGGLRNDPLKKALRPVKRAAGWFSKLDAVKAECDPNEWVYDVMRHSYGSYWLAVNHDRAKLAELMGNDVKVIKKHYRRPILEATARKYWEILPEAAKGAGSARKQGKTR